MIPERGYDPLTPPDFDRQVLGIRVARSDDAHAVTIELTANLVATNAQAFRRIVTEQLDLGARRVVIDLKHCRYTDSRGLGALVGASNDAKRRGATLSIAHPDDDLRTLFSLTQLDHVFHVCPDPPAESPEEVTP